MVPLLDPPWRFYINHARSIAIHQFAGFSAVMRLNFIKPIRKPCAISGITSAPCVQCVTIRPASHHQRTLMVVHPACMSPATPWGVSALWITAPQKGATSLLQSAVCMSVRPSALKYAS